MHLRTRYTTRARRPPPVSPRARLRRPLPHWVAAGASPWVVYTINYGLKLPWLARPAPYRARQLALPPIWEAWAGTKTGEMTHLGTVREPSPEEARRAP